MFQYEKFDLIFYGKEPEGSWSEIDLEAVFSCQGVTKKVCGFYAGNGTYVIRYLPQQTGYYGRHCTAVGNIELPETNTYRIEVLDVWEMTRETILTGVNGKVDLKLPGKEGIAVLAIKM